MPGGTKEAYEIIKDVVTSVSAQVDGGACVTHVGPGGSGNFVKMVHNGIEYGDMQLISEAYDVLKTVGGFSNEELYETFSEWNKSELQSFLIEISCYVCALYLLLFACMESNGLFMDAFPSNCCRHDLICQLDDMASRHLCKGYAPIHVYATACYIDSGVIEDINRFHSDFLLHCCLLFRSSTRRMTSILKATKWTRFLTRLE